MKQVPRVSLPAGKTDRLTRPKIGAGKPGARYSRDEAIGAKRPISKILKAILTIAPGERRVAADTRRAQERSQPSLNGTVLDNQLNLVWENHENAPAEYVAFPRWKRILDVGCILLTLPCWLPLLILVIAWIKIVSPGPIFYRQERVGYRKRHFQIFKVRTMHINAETRTHEDYFAHLMQTERPMTKLDAGGDARLIRFGGFLRATGLDELPQIFNVLGGEMSLVGPRPCLPYEFQRYDVWQQQRFNAPPGLTGYWQINGKNKTTFREMIAMDIFYVRNMSFWLDLKIILRTIPALVVQMLELQSASPGKRFQGPTHRTSPTSQTTNGEVKRT
jgi:lipopolysaccharide/colanic/teichoic acid biosynthesis glycosyltransferase